MSHFEIIKKHTLKLFTLFIILNLSSLTFVQAEGIAQAPKVVPAEASVWKIHNKLAEGTGFFIAPKLFVTNFHVLSALLKIRRKS